jgi:ferredoxin-NADP reductase
MADRGDPRPVTLIWSNRSPAHVVYSDEMEDLAAKLTGLRRVPIFTQQIKDNRQTGRLNHQSLKTILNGCSRRSVVFLCGPPQMMTQLKVDLKALGFPACSIFTETFGF